MKWTRKCLNAIIDHIYEMESTTVRIRFAFVLYLFYSIRNKILNASLVPTILMPFSFCAINL